MNETPLSQLLRADAERIEAIPQLSHDEVLNALLASEDAVRKLTESRDKVRAAVLEWVKVNGELTNGSQRWYVAKDKTEKCINVSKTFSAVMEAVAGDESQLALVLSTNAFKPGATKKLLGDETFKQLFTVSFGDVLKLKMDSGFVKAKGATSAEGFFDGD
jgi:hypothetical protein